MSEKIERRIYEITQRIHDLRDRANSTILSGEINKLNKSIKSLTKEKEKLLRKIDNEQNKQQQWQQDSFTNDIVL
jgi:predicted  nucleic acid-binding Zn-ribbon protein